ncbi:MAG TPA: Maf family nucleotide pyrophosphatase [Gammaproteobacteria bacterium]|nr:Maf family nucleotide pyrophosphatase [Gammaproteobacteria bacterium]
MNSRPLILASTSPYRRQLLERLKLPFSVASPKIDETPLPGETPHMLVLRLSESKARAVASNQQQGLIIGSDQAAVLNGEILGKPGNRPNAIAQLQKCSGNSVIFHTGLCLLDVGNGKTQLDDVLYEVKFRALTSGQIERYVDSELPFDCAGSFKAESLGICLFEYMRGEDPSSLIGLPLIRLTTMLHNAGIRLPL